MAKVENNVYLRIIQILQENDIENNKRDEQSITEYTYI